MRSFIVMAMFAASLGHAAMNDYTEVRNLELDADEIEELSIDAGAGSMDITGIAGAKKITVKAIIEVPDVDDDKALRIIEREMKLSLDRSGSDALLNASFERRFMGFGSHSARINIEISVPQGIAVIIDDGSGSIDVKNVAHVKIDDGSGSIDVERASGDVSIIDGSGSITVRDVQGSVTIDDGSGGIEVSDGEKDLIIIDDGSGGFTFSDIRGTVEQDT